MIPRVPLYGRFPFGHRTFLTESLTSFVTRLAHARSLSTTDVVEQLAFPLMRRPPTRNVGWYFNRGAASLDALGESARSFVAAIEALTGQPGLVFHTMLPWARLLNVNHAGALHPGSKRWCSKCFAFWNQHGISPWEPLIWRVKIVRRCPVHRTVLSDICPSCGKPQPVVNKRVPAGICTSCGTPLHEGDPLLRSGDVEPRFGSDECWEYWYAVAVARMLSVQSDINESASNFGFVSLVVEAVEEFGDGKSQKLAKHLGLSYTLINRITTESYLPRLEYFLTVTMRLGADPAEIALAPYGSLFRKPWASLRDRVQPWPKFTWSSPRRQVSYSPEFWARIGEKVDREITDGGRRIAHRACTFPWRLNRWAEVQLPGQVCPAHPRSRRACQVGSCGEARCREAGGAPCGHRLGALGHSSDREIHVRSGGSARQHARPSPSSNLARPEAPLRSRGLTLLPSGSSATPHHLLIVPWPVLSRDFFCGHQGASSGFGLRHGAFPAVPAQARHQLYRH